MSSQSVVPPPSGKITIFTDSKRPLHEDTQLVLTVSPDEFPFSHKGMQIKQSLVAWKVMNFPARSDKAISFEFIFGNRVGTAADVRDDVVTVSPHSSDIIEDEQYFDLNDKEEWVKHPFYHPFERNLFLVVNNSGREERILVGLSGGNREFQPFVLLDGFAHKVACMVPPAQMLRLHCPEASFTENQRINDVKGLPNVEMYFDDSPVEAVNIETIKKDAQWLLYSEDGKICLNMKPECPDLKPLVDLLRKVADFINVQIPYRSVPWAREVLAGFGADVQPKLNNFLAEAPNFTGYNTSATN